MECCTHAESDHLSDGRCGIKYCKGHRKQTTRKQIITPQMLEDYKKIIQRMKSSYFLKRDFAMTYNELAIYLHIGASIMDSTMDAHCLAAMAEVGDDLGVGFTPEEAVRLPELAELPERRPRYPLTERKR